MITVGTSGPDPVLTIGHGTLASDEFASLLSDVAVECLVDIRAFPGSRRNPQYSRDAMEEWLPAAGVDYRWARSLGGRRRSSGDSVHVALRNASFRAYADYMETREFSVGVERLLSLAATTNVAVMCSESVWWRCHRRLLADHLTGVHGVPVRHLMHDGRLTEHPRTDGARIVGGAVVYDVVSDGG